MARVAKVKKPEIELEAEEGMDAPFSLNTTQRSCVVTIKSLSTLSQSRMLDSQKKEGEPWDDFELRVWKERMNVDNEGQVVIPAMAFKQALDFTAKALGIKIAGRGQSRYTKLFTTGVVVVDDVRVGVHKDDVRPMKISVNSDGKRGSGSRVYRWFPQIPQWSGKVEFLLLEEAIPEIIFEKHVKKSGLMAGVGRWRPENGGLNGRFDVLDFKWK